MRKAGMQAMGTLRAFLQHGRPCSIEAVDHEALGLVVAAQWLCNRDGPLASGAGEQYLTVVKCPTIPPLIYHLFSYRLTGCSVFEIEKARRDQSFTRGVDADEDYLQL